MSDDPAPTVPEGLAAALAEAGLRLAGPLGAGASGARWSAVPLAGGPLGDVRRVVTLVVTRSATHTARLHERATALAAVRHPHVATVSGALVLPDGRLAVLHDAVAGHDLATLLAARPGWRAGEVVTALVPLADALAALHERGLTHGDVAPANVVVEDGRPVLVDLVLGDDPFEGGTVGYAAPERSRGATPAGDVHALGRLGIALLGPPDPPDARGRVGDPARTAVRDVLRRAGDPVAEARPTAAELAALLFAACPPEPIRPVDPAVLAQLSLRRLAEPDPARTQPRPRRARGRHRAGHPLRFRLLAATTAVLVAAVVAAATGAGRVGPVPATAPRGTASSEATGAGYRADPAAGGVAPVTLPPAAAALRLTHERAEALLAADRGRLARVTVPRSQAAAADLVAARRGGGAPGGVRLEVADVALVASSVPSRQVGVDPRPGRAGGGAGGGAACADVALTAAVGAVPAEPAPDAPAAGGAAAVVLRVCPTAGGWRVASVLAPSA
ncbi:protein kinase [Actinotalea sp. JY-7876]|uniref:protein kinase n=1 Tax=Actinotalea sp. JY-7876 TaxID=2758442 RepID=UPI0015F6FA9F|nr:protein kinase [Actinotalea sp. JY-7876]